MTVTTRDLHDCAPEPPKAVDVELILAPLYDERSRLNRSKRLGEATANDLEYLTELNAYIAEWERVEVREAQKRDSAIWARLDEVAADLVALKSKAKSGDTLQLHLDGKLRRKPPAPPKVREDLGTFTCGRRLDGQAADGAPGPDAWQLRDYNGVEVVACSHCGSMHPDDFMRAIEAGVEVEPTDKGYKAYLRGAPGPGKFYYQHLTQAQRDRFIELHNSKVMKIGYPGHFYVKPYFTRPAAP